MDADTSTRSALEDPGALEHGGPRWIVRMLIVLGVLLATNGCVGTTSPAQQSSPVARAASPQVPPASSPWYRRSVPVAIGGVAALLLIIGYVQWHTAVLERARRWLERAVVERRAEAKEQREQLGAYTRELIRTNQRLREVVEEKSRLLGVAAHDLKNPLFGIQALAEILLENEDLSDKARRRVELIRSSAAETLDLISDLLASAASTAQVQIEPEPVDMAALAQWVAHSFYPQARRKNQTIRCTVSDGPCVVAGDRRRLREALNNLVSNALKYSPPEKHVDVTVDRVSETVAVSVSDDGPGLSEYDQQRLFAAFQRLAPEPTGDEGASGLGLYITKQIVALHDGDIQVDTAPGDGSTFTMVLPATDAEVPLTPRTGPAPWDPHAPDSSPMGSSTSSH